MIPVGTNVQINKFPKATLAIIGINALFFIAEIAMPDPMLQWVFDNFAYGPNNWYNPLALFGHMFLHGDIYHIAFNMLFFWIFGGPIEGRVGSRNFVFYYLLAGCVAGILQTGMEAIARPGMGVGGIGASGAISGVMAIFLYRCFYSRMKMVIAPILLPWQINIPVIPLILFWFLQDFLMGLVSMSYRTGVGHWAHVGGFVCGIAIGRVKRLGDEGRLEKLRAEVLKKLDGGMGWKAVEKELLKLLNIAPQDPEVNQDLARLYAEAGEAGLAARYYMTAAQRFFISDPATAAYTVIEHNDALGKPMSIQMHVKAAEALCAIGDVESAKKALAPYSGEDAAEGPAFERALALNAKVQRYLGDIEGAHRAIGMLLHYFPDTSYRQEVRQALMKRPDEIFTAPKTDQEKVEKSAREEKRAEDALGTVEMLQRYFIDPAFWTILLFLNIVAPIFYPELYNGDVGPFVLFVLAYSMTVVHRMGHIDELLTGFLYFGKSDKQAKKEFDLKKLFNEATGAEKGGKYKDASELYEKFLVQDPENIQARYNLAKIYHKRLDDPRKARRHYNELTKHLAENHPFRQDAHDAMKTLTAKQA